MYETIPETYNGTYKETHPWITFDIKLDQASYKFWMDLGAIQSKIEHVANALLPPAEAQRLHMLYLAKGVHATTAIEGNTLSEEEVRDRIEENTKLPESKEYLGKEIDNIKNTCNTIGPEVWSGEDARLSMERIKKFNRMILEGLPLKEETVPGEFRKYSVGVANYRGAPWQDCEYLIQRLCKWLNHEIKYPLEISVGYAVIKAIMAHLYIAWIHPFGDGNGRTARLVEFQILLLGNVPSVAAHLLSNFYNQTRTEYYRQLDMASKSREGALDFLYYATQGLRDALDEQIQFIRKYQQKVAWRDFVHQKFRRLNGEAADRRKLLALEIPKANKSRILSSELKLLTPEIAVLYADKTDKTLNRDINELLKMKLIRRIGKEIEANEAILTKLLPHRRNADNDVQQQKSSNSVG